MLTRPTHPLSISTIAPFTALFDLTHSNAYAPNALNGSTPSPPRTHVLTHLHSQRLTIRTLPCPALPACATTRHPHLSWSEIYAIASPQTHPAQVGEQAFGRPMLQRRVEVQRGRAVWHRSVCGQRDSLLPEHVTYALARVDCYQSAVAVATSVFACDDNNSSISIISSKH